MPSIDILGIQHRYELTHSVGSGPVLVFVHGWLLSRRYWDPLIQILSPSYQCLTYDLRGFGESVLDTGAERYTPEGYAQDLVLLLRQLNISSAWVIGHSLGGSIALWAAALAPQVVQGVLCLNSGGGIYLQDEFERFRNAGRQMLRFRPSWLTVVPWISFFFRYIMVHKPLSKNWGRQRLVDFVAAQPEAALRSLLDSTEPEQVHLLPQVVSKLSQPAYFLAGTEDSVMELKYVYHLASFHKMFQDERKNVIEIANCGHMGMLEQPDAIAQEIQHCLLESQIPTAAYEAHAS